MKKSTFFAFSALVVSVCLYYECSTTYSSEAIRRAELGESPASEPVISAAPQTDSEIPPYVLELTQDSVFVVDSFNNKIIYKESFDKSGNPLIEAIYKDNE